MQELYAYLGLETFWLRRFRQLVCNLADLSIQNDKGVVLAGQALETLRWKHVIRCALTIIERVCTEAVTRANRCIKRTLIEPLPGIHKRILDDLLKVKPDSNTIRLVWLRQSPLKPNSRHILAHIKRLPPSMSGGKSGNSKPSSSGRCEIWSLHIARLLRIQWLPVQQCRDIADTLQNHS